MKGKAKLAVAFVVLALVAGSFLAVSLTQAQLTEQTEDTGNEAVSTRSYSACGGIEGCRTSCGCGCLGNPNSCGCGG